MEYLKMLWSFLYLNCIIRIGEITKTKQKVWIRNNICWHKNTVPVKFPCGAFFIKDDKIKAYNDYRNIPKLSGKDKCMFSIVEINKVYYSVPKKSVVYVSEEIIRVENLINRHKHRIGEPGYSIESFIILNNQLSQMKNLI